MSHGKQFTLYTNQSSPNAQKVILLLSELSLTYEPILLDFATQEHRTPTYLALNPNGRVPTLIDHSNSNFTLFESNAILLYLTERYDLEHRLSAATEREKAEQDQWLFFQASGQQPYFAQWFIFSFFHAEKVPSAVERYYRETERVLGVLESVLKEREWLVGGRMTIADLAFLPWTDLAFSMILGASYDVQSKFPSVFRWHNAMLGRPAIKAAREKDVEVRKAIQARAEAAKTP